MSRPGRVAVVVAAGCALGAVAAGCGTYSAVRPADTLRAGRVELAAGLAASQLGEANTVLHGAIGVTDRVEVLGQNEVWNSFVEGRVGLLHSDQDPLGLALGVGAGYAVTLVSALGEEVQDGGDSGAAVTVSASVGKRWGQVELTLAHRTFFMTAGFFAASTRIGVRAHIGDNFGLLLEGGATIHAPTSSPSLAIGIGEATTGVFVGF
ncbi:MAG: hypothetical protein H6708_25945 [Kofleriaceae bacterium]|nr:hypothetical protein [Myxococcales bacterium]MCB9563852.1 hypothetical protein [Kofleriaceae bacterium]